GIGNCTRTMSLADSMCPCQRMTAEPAVGASSRSHLALPDPKVLSTRVLMLSTSGGGVAVSVRNGKRTALPAGHAGRRTPGRGASHLPVPSSLARPLPPAQERALSPGPVILTPSVGPSLAASRASPSPAPPSAATRRAGVGAPVPDGSPPTGPAA